MKRIALLSLLLVVVLPSKETLAQLSIRVGKDGGYQSGAYEGYWSPSYTPKKWNYQMATIEFVNRTPGRADVYYMDRYGRWHWANGLVRGEKVSVQSPVGDVWVIRGNRDTISERVVARPGRQKVELQYNSYFEGDRYAPKRDRRFDVVFRNKSDRPVTLYALQPWGEWTWAGMVPPRGGEIQVRAYNDQEFSVMNRRGKVIRKYKAASNRRRVTIDKD